MIPHFNAGIKVCDEFIGHFHMFDLIVILKVTNQQIDFRIKCPNTNTPTQQNWEVLHIKEQ